MASKTLEELLTQVETAIFALLEPNGAFYVMVAGMQYQKSDLPKLREWRNELIKELQMGTPATAKKPFISTFRLD